MDADDVLTWAMESYWIMRTPATGYAGNPGNPAFDEVYAAQNKLIVLEQIEKAGVRLRTFSTGRSATPARVCR